MSKYILYTPEQVDEKSIESVIQLITACITFLTLIVSILKIITKYVFPANDEEYITRIVEIIQNNDLENKKENIRVRISNAENEMEQCISKGNSAFESIKEESDKLLSVVNESVRGVREIKTLGIKNNL